MSVSHTRCEDSTWSSLSKEVVTSEEQERWASFLSLCVVALLSWSTAPFISLQYFQFYLRYFARLSYVVCAFHFWPKYWGNTMIDLKKWIRLSMIWSITNMFKDYQSNYLCRYHFLRVRVDNRLLCIQLYQQQPHFLWLSWRECTKCASHSSAAIRHSPSNNLPLQPLPSNGECIELVLKIVNYIYEFHGLGVLAHQSCITGPSALGRSDPT